MYFATQIRATELYLTRSNDWFKIIFRFKPHLCKRRRKDEKMHPHYERTTLTTTAMNHWICLFVYRDAVMPWCRDSRICMILYSYYIKNKKQILIIPWHIGPLFWTRYCRVTKIRSVLCPIEKHNSLTSVVRVLLLYHVTYASDWRLAYSRPRSGLHT